MLAFLYAFWFRIRSRFVRDSLEDELKEELRLHAELLEEEALRGGATRDDAKRAAAFRLGNVSNIRETTRQQWSFGLIDAFLQDTKYAVRFLRRSPGFTAVAVLSLALGVGENATVFAVADRLLFSAPPHVLDASGLYLLNVTRVTGANGATSVWPMTTRTEYFALRRESHTLESMALYTDLDRRVLGRGPDAPRIKEAMVSENFFDVLGVRAERGRLFLPDDSSYTRSDVPAVISHSFWQRQFGGSDSAIGSHFIASKMNFVVLGVPPSEFTGVDIDAADTWVPINAAAPARIGRNWQQSGGSSSHVVARLKSDVSAATASAEATVIVARIQERGIEHPAHTVATFGPIIQARGPAEQNGEVQVSTRLVLASVFVLIAACANLANLLLVRALSRRREIALRLAIGVSRSRLLSQMLIESLLIATAGLIAALTAARWSGGALRSLVFPQMQWATQSVNLHVILYATLCGLVVALLATVLPAIRMTRNDVSAALRSAAPQLATSTGRLRQTLLTLQVALSVVLIVGATTFTQSLREAYSFDMGLDVDRLVTARYSVEFDSLGDVSRLATLEEAAGRIRLLPGVERASVAQAVPLLGSTNARMSIPERQLAQDQYAVKWNVTPDLQQTVGFHLKRGRWITNEDVAPGMPPVVLASETMARTLWPGMDPLGRCVKLGNQECAQVIGVVHDLRPSTFREDAPLSILVGAPTPTIGKFWTGYVIVRTRIGLDPAILVQPIRKSLHDLRPDLSVIEVLPLAQQLDRDTRPLRLGSATFGSFAILAIILAAIGLYGILAFSVAQRTNEFGIRGALGARASHLVRNVVGEGIAIVVVGLVAGAILSWYASSAIAALLFNTSARDAAPYAFAALALSIVALAASAVPAWRATRIDPASALRAD